MLSKLKVTDGIPNEDFLVCGRGCMSNVQKERNANVRDQIFFKLVYNFMIYTQVICF